MWLTILKNWKIVIVFLLITFLLCSGGLWYIGRLKEQRDQYKAALAGANAAIEAQEQAMAARIEIERREDDLINQIEREPDENNGPTAAVLRNAIMRLQRPAE